MPASRKPVRKEGNLEIRIPGEPCDEKTSFKEPPPTHTMVKKREDQKLQSHKQILIPVLEILERV